MRRRLLQGFHRVRADVGNLVEQLNLRHVWRWIGLAGVVGIIAGLGALAFQWLTEQGTWLFWAKLIGYTPATPGGEPLSFPAAAGPPSILFLLIAPAIGGLCSAFLVYRFAPEAEGHGTDAAIRAYHRRRGRIAPRIPIVKMLASAITLSSGGSAGREGPIAQIGAGFGSVLGGWLKLPDRERRILLAAGLGAGVASIFRAPLAGALFAAEVLYSEPDLEPDVLLPALLSSIIAYCVYCSVHGFGHLFTGTSGFSFQNPLSLLPYLVLGLVVALGAIAYVSTFAALTAFFKRLRLSNYLKPVLGAVLTGAIGIAVWKATGDLRSLAVMGSGYGTLQEAVSAGDALGPPAWVLLVVALGKIVTTSLTIGSGGSGGVFGPSMVIGGCLGAVVGSAFHSVWPEVVPQIGPFTIVGMVGFFAGAANTPISTLIMVGDMTGNYSLLLPSMLVATISFLVAKRWTIYSEQVPTRADSDAHRGEFQRGILEGISVGEVFNRDRVIATVGVGTPLREIAELITRTTQHHFPVLDEAGKLAGAFSLNDVRAVLYEPQLADLVVARDLCNGPPAAVTDEDSLDVALGLVTMRDMDEIAVVSRDDRQRFIGFVSRRDIIAAYTRRLAERRGG
jgi:CIC family chloride channel protein